jgi:hypothetical protein
MCAKVNIDAMAIIQHKIELLYLLFVWDKKQHVLESAQS